MMMYPTAFDKMLLISITLASLSVDIVYGKVTCYVCSYSASDTINSSIPVKDSCTPTNFQPTSTFECDGGCETVAYRESKKDKIRHFHRNCVDANSGRVLSDRCIDIKGKTMYEEKCECLSNLCNSSPLWSSVHVGVLLSMSLTIMMVFLSQVSFISFSS